MMRQSSTVLHEYAPDSKSAPYCKCSCSIREGILKLAIIQTLNTSTVDTTVQTHTRSCCQLPILETLQLLQCSSSGSCWVSAAGHSHVQHAHALCKVLVKTLGLLSYQQRYQLRNMEHAQYGSKGPAWNKPAFTSLCTTCNCSVDKAAAQLSCMHMTASQRYPVATLEFHHQAL